MLQDTFVAVWQGARRYQGTGEVGAWMWGIAIRRLVSRLRTRRDVVLLPDLSTRGPASVAVEDELLQGVQYGDLGRAMAGSAAAGRALPADGRQETVDEP